MKKPFHNKTKTILMIAGVEIPPGEVRHLEEALHPVQTAAAQINPNQVLVDLLAKSVKNISAELSELTIVELGTLKTLEEAAETPRSSLLEAIGREGMARAQDPNDEEYQRAAAFAETLKGKTAEELQALRDDELDAIAESDKSTDDLVIIDAAIEFVKAGE